MGVRVTDSNGLVWNATIDDSELDRVAKRIESRVGVMSSNVATEGDKMSGMFKNLAVGAAAFFTAQQGMQLVNGIIKVRGEFQQLEIAFGTMLQSKEKADKLMAEMVDLAAKTPFGLQDVASGAKQLLAYGFAAEDVTKNITMLGNVASGVGSQVTDLIYLYGTLKASGRVTQMDINQFAGRGIPIYAELAKVLNTNVEAVRNFVSEGKVGFADIEKAFQNMTSQSGMFYNLMEAQSASLTGQISNLQDAIAQMFNEIGQSQEGVFSKGIEGITYLVENYKEVGKILGILITTYGAYRAALILNNALTGATAISTGIYDVATKRLIVSKTLLTTVTNIATAAQARLNAMFAANPLGLVVTVVAALASSYYFLRDSTTAAERAQDALNKRNEESIKKHDELKTKTNELLAIINDDKQAKEQQVLAFQQLQELYKGRLDNLTLESFKLKGATQAQKELNQAQSDFKRNDLTTAYNEQIAKVDELSKKLQALSWDQKGFFGGSNDKKISEELEQAKIEAGELKRQMDEVAEATKLASMSSAEQLNYYKKQIAPIEQQIRSWEASSGKINKNIDGTIALEKNFNALSIWGLIGQFNTLISKINAARNAAAGISAGPRTVGIIEGDIAKKQEELKNISDKKVYAESLKEIKKLEAEKRAITGEVDKDAARAAKSAESATKVQERATSKRMQFLNELAEAEQKLTTAQMVEGGKQLAEIQYRYAKMRDAAKKAGVKDAGVFQRIDNLESKETGAEKFRQQSEKQFKEIDKLQDRYRAYEEYKTQVGKEEADKRFANEVNTNSNYMAQLQAMKAMYSQMPLTGQVAAVLEKVNEKIAEENKRKFDEETGKQGKALIDFATYQQKREAIIKDYNERVKVLGENATEDQKREAERQKKIAFGQLADEYADRLTESKRFFNGLILNSRKAVEVQIRNIERLLQMANLDPELRKKLLNDLAETKSLLKVDHDDLELVQLQNELREIDRQLKAINDGTPESVQRKTELMVQRTNLVIAITDKNLTSIDKTLNKISKAAPAIAALGDALSALGGEGSGLAELGAGLSTFAGGLQNLVTQIKDLNKNGATSTDAIVAGLQFAFQLITTIADASKKRKQAEQDFYLNVLGLQEQYNLSLIEQKRLQAELSENIFLTDYFGRAKSGMEAAIAAADKYQKAIDKLVEGRSKERQKDVVDGKTLGQLALSGAAAGAVIGTAIGGWAAGIGTVIGTVVGGIVGLVGGLFAKKKKDVWGGLLTEWPELVKTTANGYKEINVELAKALLANNQLDDKTKALVQNVLNAKDAYEASYKQMADVVKDLAGNLGNDLRNSLVEAWKAGEDSVKAFGDTVDKVLENILSNLLFNAVFNDVFTQLQKDLTDDFVQGGISDITDTMAAFFKQNKENIDKFNAAMAIASEQAKQAGLDVFQKNTGNSKNSFSGSIQQITQQQADVLTGQFYAQTTVLNDINNKIPANFFFDSLGVMDRQFEMLSKIENNTGNTVNRLDKAVDSLKSIDNKMSNTANQAAAAGYKI